MRVQPDPNQPQGPFNPYAQQPWQPSGMPQQNMAWPQSQPQQPWGQPMQPPFAPMPGQQQPVAPQYTPEQLRMFEVRPGITGWAQVNGRKDVPWPRRIEMNVWYVDHVSLWLDIKILFMTVFKVLTNADNENKGATVKKPEEEKVGGVK